ncbi:glycerol kinase [Mycolicibacterium phlei DSM 43072]|uniref:ATP:glycerol 3-phosphotransferase n=2 Tax=Mycolicibacterium phlei TaxID=1771 RepID=A0A5N5V6A3_MYCPH|nr:glycerol kinase [Mycolicibacterium phlei DSM 43239 = CCUG 21000]KXW65764.1 glycerol kinase [Mycolicibacterium phlei DSM 43239 = CCUG 21000]KXW68407.1 glycerol kinase [Mycolicibacterium phlei DSM 43072]KXW69445.1 glycerol kinase [Mycolicibacterium phlei DSM 43070]KXW77515.1 glycerol kinase [Mycolicibacterium phlei DSM 43071]
MEVKMGRSAIRVWAGVDQGTTSTRTNLYDDDGRCVASAQRQSVTAHPHPGWDEQDGEALQTAIEDTLREALASLPGAELAGIGLANQGESIIAFDRRTGKPLSKAILWSDRRATEVVDRMSTSPEADRIEAITGLHIDPYYSAAKIAWSLLHLPEVADAAAAGTLAISTLDAFFIHRLTQGAAYVTDPSTGSRTQLMGLDDLRFNADVAAAFGIDTALLPTMVETVFAEPLPTTLGAPLYASAADQLAALAALGAISPGDTKMTYGTGCFIETNVGATPCRPGHGLMATYAWTIPGEPKAWAVEGGVFSAATAVNWLVHLGLAESPSHVAELAAACPAAGDAALRMQHPLFLPSFTGVGAPWWRADAAGVLNGLRASTDRSDVAFAVVDGIAQRVADVIDAMDAELGSPVALRADGGLSRNRVLMQRQADLCGRPVAISDHHDNTAAGAAGLAAIGAGELDLAGLAARATFSVVVEPTLPEAQRQAERDRWRAFVESTAALDPSALTGRSEERKS